MANGTFEYGFTFGAPANEEDLHTTGPCEIGDVEFDIVLGVEVDGIDPTYIDAQWAKYQWVAEAIMKAQP
jgi:hypothetical protein